MRFAASPSPDGSKVIPSEEASSARWRQITPVRKRLHKSPEQCTDGDGCLFWEGSLGSEPKCARKPESPQYAAVDEVGDGGDPGAFERDYH